MIITNISFLSWNTLNSYFSTSKTNMWNSIYEPLQILYLHGPSISGYGFWGGTEHATICATSTGTEARFWEQHNNNMDECDRLVDKKVTGFVLMCLSLISITTVYYILSGCYTRLVYVNPIIAEMREFRKICNNSEVLKLKQH